MSNTVVSNFIWRFMERIGAQLVSFIVSIVLARLLDPVVYGTVAIVTVFTAILQVFVDSGYASALIQKKDADDLDFSSIFWFNLGTSIILYILIFVAAPFIEKFYGMSSLALYVRVMGIVIIISALKNVQQAYVSRHMIFKKFFYATLVGTIASAIIGIWMAYQGYGVWALIAQNILNQAIDTLMLYIIVPWKPKLMFSWKRFCGLFNYGWKILVSSLIDTFYTKLNALIIGKVYTSEDLSFYDKGHLFPNLIITNINSSINSVLLPTMSKAQNDKRAVKNMTRKSIKLSTFLIMPMMMGLAVCAESIVKILLTDKWLPCVFFLRVFCFTMAFYPIHSANLSAINAMGRSDYYLVLEILKKVVGLATIVATMFISVEAMAIGCIFSSIASQIINSWPNKKLLNYSYLQQLKDIMPSILLAVAMGAIVYPVGLLPLPTIVLLILQVLTGAIVYVAGAWLFKFESFTYMLNLLKSFLSKKKKVENNEAN